MEGKRGQCIFYAGGKLHGAILTKMHLDLNLL